MCRPTLPFKVILVSILYFVPLLLHAQQPINTKNNLGLAAKADEKICYNDVLLNNLRKGRAFREKEDKMNLKIRNYPYRSNGAIITLPVVVHIINTNPTLITDLQVIDGIKLLNDAYSKSGI
ncbi:MAG: hypothetical protein H7320_17370, partial [Ferruginibacter sp.]|nr:hypothetical protein [Ferruginibacter sp.]